MAIRKIYLFRHGETFYNERGIFTGWKDSKLSPRGVKSAKIIARKLKNKKFEIAFYTRLSRSKDTLKEVLKFHPECKKLIRDDRMIERNYGILNGTSHEAFIKEVGKRLYDLEVYGDFIYDMSERSKKKLKYFLGEQEYEAIHRGYDVKPPRGESFAMVEKRVARFIMDLKKIMKKRKTNVAISAHGNSIRLFRKIMEKATKVKTTEWKIPYDEYYGYSINV